MIVNQIDRRFQIWEYSVSMARLLLRSTKSGAFDKRLDVLFQNVKAVKVLTEMNGLVVAEADPEVEAKLATETGLLATEHTKFFTVRSGMFEGYVVATICVTAEDAGEYYEPSPLWPGA